MRWKSSNNFPILWFCVKKSFKFRFFFGNYEPWRWLRRQVYVRQVHTGEGAQKNFLFLHGRGMKQMNVYMLSKHLHKNSIKAYPRSHTNVWQRSHGSDFTRVLSGGAKKARWQMPAKKNCSEGSVIVGGVRKRVEITNLIPLVHPYASLKLIKL